jgi:quinol-cytochrome oxidoreductase complex cytochrome b subunit
MGAIYPGSAVRPGGPRRQGSARNRAVLESQRPVRDDSLIARVWRSIFRGPVIPASDRERKWIVFNTLLLHLRPIRVPAATLRYTHTFGLGGMSLTLVLLLMGTGALLVLAYEPTAQAAHASIRSLEGEVLFGRLVRSVHHWSANLLVVVALLHLLRVFATGAFRGPRQFNWIVGLSLLACVATSSFTGYLLPWDQRSYWAVTIVTGMFDYVPALGEWLQRVVRGGSEIGTSTLVTFYALHTTLVPVAIAVLMALHFWRVRKAGGVVRPRTAEEPTSSRPETVLFLPNLLVREVAVALTLIAGVLVLAIAAPAALGEPANPGMSPNPAKAPWFFMGFQELLLHFDPLFAVVVIPLAAAAGLLALPYLRCEAPGEGNWFLTASGRRTALAAAILALLVTSTWIVIDEFFAPFGAGVPSALSRGVLPCALLAIVLVGFTAFAKRSWRASRSEAIQGVFVLFFVSFAVLTLTGVWFRGTGMALTWPWNL